jgi:hypothetical protein
MIIIIKYVVFDKGQRGLTKIKAREIKGEVRMHIFFAIL